MSDFRRRSVTLLVALAGLLAVAGCKTPPARDPTSTLAEELYFEGDFVGAIELYSRALDQARRRGAVAAEATALLARADCYVQLAASAEPMAGREHLQAAEADFESVLELGALDSDDDGTAHLEALFGLAQVEARRSDEAPFASILKRLTSLASPEQPTVFLWANQQMGWLLLNRYLSRPASRLEEDAATRRPQLEAALNHFLEGLWVDPNDAACALGKGICLTEIGLVESAIDALELSLERTRALGWKNPLAHFYLALAHEQAESPRARIVKHLDSVLDQDPQHELGALYDYLLERLPRYYEPSQPRFRTAVNGILAQRERDVSYWERAERLFDSYVGSLEAATTTARARTDDGRATADLSPRKLAFLGRAIARRHLGRIEAAADDLLQLRGEPTFPEHLDRLFPPDSRRAAAVYGRLRCLVGLGQLQQVESMIFDGLQVRADGNAEDEYRYRIEGIVGLVLLQIWQGLRREVPELARQPASRDRYLPRALRAFETYLEHLPDSAEARTGLAQTLEALERLDEAIAEYSRVAGSHPGNTEAFGHLLRLHRDAGLRPAQRLQVWDALKGYAGADPSLLRYLESQKDRLTRERQLYCSGCGRRTSAAELICLYCGRTVPGRKSDGDD